MPPNKQGAITATIFPLISYRVKDIAWTFAFTAAALIFPAILAHTPHNQWLTGIIVNALLFLAVWRVGIVNSFFVAVLPSSIALVRGLLPATMATLIPYIVLSNILLMFFFYSTKKYPLLGIVMASTAKFLFLFTVTSFFIKIATPLLAMMQWPQLFTSLAGGLIAVSIIKLVPAKNKP